jgi:MFS family permease
MANTKPERFPLRVWLISFLGWTFDFYDLMLISFLLIPIGADLMMTAAEESVMLGIALGASGIGGILFGYLSDRYGRKRIMTWTIGLYSFGTALCALATGPWTLLIYRLITGLGVGGEWAVGHALVQEASPKHMRGRSSAFLQAGEPVGVGIAAVVGLLVTPVIGWRWVFALSSLSAVVAFIARRHLPESTLWEREKSEELSPKAALVWIKQNHFVSPMVKGFVLGVFKLGTYWTCYVWLPRFLQQQFHQPVGRSAVWIVTAQTGQFLGMLLFGVAADRYGRRLAYTVYSLLTAVALYGLAFHWQSLLGHPSLFWAVMFGMGVGSGCTAGFGALLAELFPTEVRNFAMGSAYNCARGVQFFAPMVVSSFVALYGVRGGLGVPLVLALATAAWVWTLPETRRRDLANIRAEQKAGGVA